MNFDPIFSASPVIQIHLAAALLALITGGIMWRRPKGTPSHKLMGRFFIVLMLVTAASAIFIQEINKGHYSWIHIFVPITLYTIVSALWAIKNRNITRHKQAVKALYFYALIIPGVFTLMPGRRLFAVFFGS